MTKKVRIKAGVFKSDQCSPCRNPEESVALNLRQTNTRNVVTTRRLSRWERKAMGRRYQPNAACGGMVQEAKAAGKANGYADVDPVK